MKTFKPLFYTFFILTFTSCRDYEGPMDSPCSPQWLVQIVVKNINRENYPITVYFRSADEYPPIVNFDDFAWDDSGISLEDGGWKIEDDGKYKERKYNILYWSFLPYCKYKDESKRNFTLDKQLVGKDRKVTIHLLNKNHNTIFKNYISVRADTYHLKDYGWTLYDAKKIEATNTNYLTHLNKGISSNCNGISFDLNKQH